MLYVYAGDDSNNNSKHDNNNNTYKSSTSVKVDIDKRKTPQRNQSTVSIPYELATSGGAGRGQSQLSQYSSVTGKSEEDKEKKMAAKAGRKSGTTLVVFLLELVSLAGLIVLAYFLRFTEKFAVVERDFNCADPSFNLKKKGPDFKDSIIFGSLTVTEYYLIHGLGPILLVSLFYYVKV